MSRTVQSAYSSPRIEMRSCPGKRGQGVFAKEPIAKDEVITVWGGDVMTLRQMSDISFDLRRLSIQVEDDLYLVPGTVGPGDRINHSCEPNAGLRGQISLVAMKEIAAGDEICFDYAMSDTSTYDEFSCICGTPLCRGAVSGNDWKRPELWERYEGYFSPYIQRRINILKSR
ncbi:MAG: SET domain-containing protein-lysine N-methyltransferase [Spirochaetales bacterium]|nr:MAG: SET domain-containing protein-lysine N-methyltransferase [Spirochaetales bacterium]